MSIKKDFSLMAILLIPVAVAINIVGGQLVNLLKIPLHMDAIGTILISAIAGPWVGALTGLLGNLINSIFAPQLLPYAFVSICIALTVGFMARAKMFTTVPKTIVTALVVVVVAVIAQLPITVFIFGGVSGGGSSLVTGAFLTMGQSLVTSVLSSGFIVEIFDKTISCLIAFFIVKGISMRYLSKFSLGDIYIGKKSA